MCVLYAPTWQSLTVPSLDRVDYEQSHHDHRYAPDHVKTSRGSWQPRFACECHLHSIRCRTHAYHLTGSSQVSKLDYQTIPHFIFVPSTQGESPPPPPGIFFGRDGLIENVVDIVEHLAPVALIGTGGIGKTSTVLTVLHHDQIKRRFGDNRRFIHCDRFTPSLPQFLRQLSQTIGASIKNPESLTPLRPFLSSSKDMLIILDNAESILDPYVTNAEEIYEAVEELSRLSNICICITSRISTFPPNFEWFDIPTLSKEAACDTFYRIYKHGQRSDRIDNILERLDFHALSITLLATSAHHNRWDTSRLAKEWDARRTDVLQTGRNKGLAAAVELSLSSPTFQELGPDARDLLSVIAFFPQGVNESKIDWLFPTIPRRKDMVGNFCVLSLTYRDNGFITMLAPVRDYLSPRNPMLIPLLCPTRDCYFTRLSVDVEPGKPGFEEARWIVLEDVNAEHLLETFTTVDGASCNVWDACADFMKHLFWHKPRPVTLGPKLEALADDHPSKLECLYQLSRLFETIENYVECKRLLTLVLELSRERGDEHLLAQALSCLSHAHSSLGLFKEGVRLAKEASEIAERLGDPVKQAWALTELGWSLNLDKQLDGAEEAVFHAIDLLSGRDEKYRLCKCLHLLGRIYRSKEDTEKSIRHYEAALGIASSFNGFNLLFWIRFDLAQLFCNRARFDDANAHIQHAKLHAVSDYDSYTLAYAMELQARVWLMQRRFEEAKSEGLRALDAFEKLGVEKHAERTRELLLRIDHDSRVLELSESCEPLKKRQLLSSTNPYVWMGSQNDDIGICLETRPSVSQCQTLHPFTPSIVELFNPIIPHLPIPPHTVRATHTLSSQCHRAVHNSYCLLKTDVLR